MKSEIKKIIAASFSEPNNLENTLDEFNNMTDDELSLTCYSLWGLPVPPISVVRAAGVKVQIFHSRWVKGQGVKKTRDLIAAGFTGRDFQPRAGVTEVIVTFPDGEVKSAKSICSKSDHFCYRDGAYLTLSKILLGD